MGRLREKGQEAVPRKKGGGARPAASVLRSDAPPSGKQSLEPSAPLGVEDKEGGGAKVRLEDVCGLMGVHCPQPLPGAV